MSTDASDVRADLAFLRALAEDGGHALRSAGAAIGLAGVVFGLNALRQWGLAAGWLAWPEALEPYLFWDALVAQLVLVGPVLWLVRRGEPRRSRASAVARAVEAALSAVGGALVIAMLALAAAATRLGEPAVALTAFPIVLFALNGTAWWVAFAAYRRIWALAVALGSFATALTLGWFAGQPTQWLALGVGLFFWLAAPGIALARQPRSAAPSAPARAGV
jgi:hypothetical protein